jgi:hypothetical protein
LENVQLYSSFQRVRVVLLQGGENFPARCAGAAWPGARTRKKARTAYRDFLTLWKDADPDIPILKEAKAEYAKLQS